MRHSVRKTGLVFVVALAAAATLAGCSPKKVLVPNLAPKTQLFIHYDPADGVTHTVNHVAHLYWLGSDPDGYVVGYDIRFIWPGGPASPAWTRTTRTDSLFLVPDTTGISNPTFEVRAVDNDGLVDPAPPSQSFSFSNQAPTVTLLDPPNVFQSTFATQTIDWQGIDPDGDANLLTYRVWLDGNEADPHVTTAQEFTFPTADFLLGGVRATRNRTAFVQAIDAGGRLSNIASATWQVRSPVSDTLQRARLLVIDDVRASVGEPGGAPFKTFFDGAITRSGIPAGSFTLLELGTGRPFRTSKDLEQSFRLFDAVVWYRGQLPYGGTPFDANRDTLLTLHSDAIAAYLDAGGKFYMESADLIDSPKDSGLFKDAFMQQYFGSNYIVRRFGATDSTASWSYSSAINGVPAWLHSTVFNDSLHFVQNGTGVRVFGARDTSDVVLWARSGTLSATQQAFDAPVGVRSITAGGGKVVVSSIPLLAAGGATGGGRFIDKVFQYLGIRP